MFEPFSNLAGFRTIGSEKFIASCPCSIHARGDRSRGLSGKVVISDAERKILLACGAGCKAKDILDAMGLGWDALFLDRGYQMPTARMLRRQAALEGFRNWRDNAVTEAGIELRTRDGAVLAAEAALECGSISEAEFWEVLSGCYRGYSALEYRWEVLRTGTDAEALEVHRNG